MSVKERFLLFGTLVSFNWYQRVTVVTGTKHKDVPLTGMEGTEQEEHPFVPILKREFAFPLVLATDPNCYMFISFGNVDLPRAQSLCRRYNIDPCSVSCPQPDSLCFLVPTEGATPLALSRTRQV